MGTSVVATDLGWTSVVSVHPEDRRYAVLNAEGGFTIGLDGEVVVEGKTGFTRRMSAFFHKDYLVMAGDAADGRFVVVVSDGRVAARIRVPHRAIPAMDPAGKLTLLRSTQAGLESMPLSRNPAVSDVESTAHNLRVYDSKILGYTVIGLVVWDRLDPSDTTSMRLTDLGVASLSPDGERAALGTRSGAVAIARLDSHEERARPDLVRAFEGPVTGVEFASKGRWLATAGDNLVIWTWED
jgi:hypothetical protein